MTAPAVRPRAGQASHRPNPVLAAVLVTVVAWASAFVAIRGVRDTFDPGALALGRLTVGSVVLSLTLLVQRSWVTPTRPEWGMVVVCGVAWFAVYNVALNAAERHVDAGTAAMLVNIGPILIALLAGGLLGEGFPSSLLIGTGVAFSGAVMIGTATTSSTGWTAPGCCCACSRHWPGRSG